MQGGYQEERLEKLQEKKDIEIYDRLTAAFHVHLDHFSKHVKIEGYQEYADAGHFFGCDRLLKVENMFGKMQIGYNPNRGRSFLFANLKTSRYDTISSRYQKELKEYQMKSLLKGKNQNRAYLARRMEEAAVLIEKADTKPWGEATVAPYLKRKNLESMQKTLPFFDRSEEKERYQENLNMQKALKRKISSNARKGEVQNQEKLRKEQNEKFREGNRISALLYRKEASSRYYTRKINYAFDIQKHEMFEFYKNKLQEKLKELSQLPEESDENNEDSDR